STQLAKIRVQLRGALLAALLSVRNLQDRPAARPEQHIAVPVRVGQAALIGVEWSELAGDGEQVRCLLNHPPVVRNRLPGLVVTSTHICERTRGQSIAIAIVE